MARKFATADSVTLSELLERAGVRVYRTICYPLAGTGLWRQKSYEFPSGPEASNFRFDSGETVQDVLRGSPDYSIFYVDLTKGNPLRIQIKSPFAGAMTGNADEQVQSPLMSAMNDFIKSTAENLGEQYDSYIFLREATPMQDRCTSMNK